MEEEAMKARYLIILLLMALSIVGCRRDLWVHSDNFYTVRLNVDWHDYGENDPGGMTVWFFPTDSIGQHYSYTTAQVRQADLYLSRGIYHGVVCDYSPQEFSTIEFLDMDNYEKARVQLTAEGNQPEPIALDTLKNMVISNGPYEEYIPYDERDNYQQSLNVQQFQVRPHSLVWKMRLRIYVKGIEYLYQVHGELTGLADGHYLARDVNTERSCTVSIDEWTLQPTGDNEGYIATTISTFGLRPDHENISEDLKLNLRFLLRDRTTVRTYSFDLGDHIVSFSDQQVLRVDMGSEVPGLPDLPYVEAYDGAGFDGVVTPWNDDEPPVDVIM